MVRLPSQLASAERVTSEIMLGEGCEVRQVGGGERLAARSLRGADRQTSCA
jgi:hypothetical protein